MWQFTERLRVWSGGILAIAVCSCSQAANVPTQQKSTGLHLPSGIAQIVRPTIAIQELTAAKNNETVHIKGTVIKQAPLLAGSLYQVQDEDGTVWVLSSESPPAVDVSVNVVGTLQVEAIAVEGIDISDFYLRETSRTVTTGDTTPEAPEPPEPDTDASTTQNDAE
ncbi:MAG: hypothetical protein AAF622_03585 [Cyanobacteria bacterium P01_C01_bin.147]